MSKKKENKKNTRREFLQQSALIAAATTSAGFLLNACKNEEASSGEKVNVLTQDGAVVEVNKSQLKVCPQGANRKESRKGIAGRKFVMLIDLSKCKNARKCVESCQEMHHLPTHMEYLKVYLMKDSKNTAAYWMPKPCFHCDNPPCVSLCPVGATFKRSDGIVLIDNKICIGCKFCMTGCPYSARIFNWAKHDSANDGAEYSPETGHPRVHGTVSKCDFCPEMARKGVLPSCVTACPNGVIYYGDFNEDAVSNGEEVVRFSEMIKNKGGYQYADELGTEPSVYYLPPVDRIFPVENGLDNIPDGIDISIDA